MSDAAVAAPSLGDSSKTLGVTDGKLAMWIFLGSDGMSFMGLIAAYIALRAGNADQWPNPTQHLAINLTAVNTFVLICSSLSMVKAYLASVDNDKRGITLWLAATILGGCIFLGIQVYEYTHQITAGFTVSGFSEEWVKNWAAANPGETLGSSAGLFCATFYVLTCFHGCHVFSGVVYLTVVLIGVLRNRWTVNRLEIVGLYWHFVDLVWIVIFTIVYLVE